MNLAEETKVESGKEKCPRCDSMNTETITDPIVWQGGDHTRAFCLACRIWF
jgi:phage FluMu protein Com